MRSHVAERIQIAHPHFHLLNEDGLYHPIAFLFVSERMCDDILDEREMLLSLLPSAQHARQTAIFARYDPMLSARAFKDLLLLYGNPFVNSSTD